MFSRQADPLRQLSERLGQASFAQVLQLPGVSGAVRVSIQPHEAGVPASVATVAKKLSGTCALQVVYDKYDSNAKPYNYTFEIPVTRFQAVISAFRRNKFDGLDDEPNLPLTGADIWLVERGAGTFRHDVVLSPQSAGGNHREIVLAIQQHLAEATRRLNI